MEARGAELPGDLIKFLTDASDEQLEMSGGEAGEVTLHRAPVSRTLPVEPEEGVTTGESVDAHDVPVFDLVATCDDAFDPDGILVWAPEEQSYGTWDADHWQLLLYPGVAWADIVEDPYPYLDGQWDPPDGSVYLDPRGRYPVHAKS